MPVLKGLGFGQARSQVLRFGRQNAHLEGQDFCFYCMFETIFSGHNKIWGAQSTWALPPNAPVATGLDLGHHNTFR